MIREKKTKSGKLLEIDYYPIYGDSRHVNHQPLRKSTEAQEKYNKLQAQKKIVRLVNANFWNDDVLLTLTYKPADSPLDDKQAKRDITNYLRRVKYFREKKAKDLKKQIKAQPKNKKLKADLKKASEPMKYIYAFECKTYKKGKRKGQKSYHFHLFLTGCGSGDRDEYEKLWNGRTNADRFQPESFGPDAAAKYIAKGDGATQGQKKYVCSKNLVKPVQKVRDDKVSKRKTELMATRHSEDREYWERRYKGYKFLKCYARWNEYNMNWYISVVMYKTDEDVPEWSFEDW